MLNLKTRRKLSERKDLPNMEEVIKRERLRKPRRV